jgi:hypothetical protein
MLKSGKREKEAFKAPEKKKEGALIKNIELF